MDKDSGLVHTVEVTAANEHDVTMTAKLLHGEEETVNGDSGYIGAEKREDAILKNKNGKKIRYNINPFCAVMPIHFPCAIISKKCNLFQQSYCISLCRVL